MDIQTPIETETEPHYVVITGTNIRSTLPGNHVHTPKVYDSAGIAPNATDADAESQRRRGISAITPRSPISVAEYDWKYSAYQDISKE